MDHHPGVLELFRFDRSAGGRGGAGNGARDENAGPEDGGSVAVIWGGRWRVSERIGLMGRSSFDSTAQIEWNQVEHALHKQSTHNHA